MGIAILNGGFEYPNVTTCDGPGGAILASHKTLAAAPQATPRGFPVDGPSQDYRGLIKVDLSTWTRSMCLAEAHHHHTTSCSAPSAPVPGYHRTGTLPTRLVVFDLFAPELPCRTNGRIWSSGGLDAIVLQEVDTDFLTLRIQVVAKKHKPTA